jgi:uncharacterized protein (DUF924 family)
MSDAEAVIDFWVGTPLPDGSLPPERFARFWKKDAELDGEIRERFGALRDRASRGELDDWATTPRGRVALVILLDQFSRNIYRGSPRAFEADEKAAHLASEGIDKGELTELAPMLGYFLVMPLMHAEAVELQNRCVQQFQQMAEAAGAPALEKVFAAGADFAVRHRDIVARFGRFPHRNDVLGRESTPEEVEFLKQPGSSF